MINQSTEIQCTCDFFATSFQLALSNLHCVISYFISYLLMPHQIPTYILGMQYYNTRTRGCKVSEIFLLDNVDIFSIATVCSINGK